MLVSGTSHCKCLIERFDPGRTPGPPPREDVSVDASDLARYIHLDAPSLARVVGAIAKHAVRPPLRKKPWTQGRDTLRGTMMDFPLTLTTILDRAGRYFPSVEIVSRKPDRSLARTCYGNIYVRARRLANALVQLGLQPGDRVASMMWNHASHLEAFFGVPCAGGILHTLNFRLHPHEIAAIANHAGDRFLLIDDVMLPVYEKFCADVAFEQIIVVPFGTDTIPSTFLNYEELLSSAHENFEYPRIDENDGAVMAYTSGTTGFSKGVVYSHRALVLHAFCSGLGETFGIGYADTALPVTPMFHATAWGLPYAASMLGARLVLPGPHLDPESILDLLAGENVTVTCGVPTVWLAVLDHLEKTPQRWSFAEPVRVLIGGTAPPLGLIRGLDTFGLHIKHLWGMTETTPVGLSAGLLPHMSNWAEEKRYETRAKQGMPPPFVEIRLMSPKGATPWDGTTSGEMEIRGPWVARSYYEARGQADSWTQDGWFRTGDVATQDEYGYVKIVDRAKDLVKSGGEWISSVDLENALMGHPVVKEACVVGIPHPKWQERPLAAIVVKDGNSIAPEDLRAFLAKSFARWQIPDAFVFVDAIPRTSVGKFKKAALREQFANWNWES